MGLPVLDEMLGGGLPAGYSMLLVGPAGSGKTMLSTEFLAEGVRQGETAVLAVFEKNPGQMMNEELDTMVRSGNVAMLNVRSLDLSIDETLHELSLMIEHTGAKRVVLDSLSGFELALAAEYREDFRESLYRMATVLNAKGVTLLMTTELVDHFDQLRFSPYGSAFMVDAILMLRYFEAASHLHTAISVVKVRGSKHSRQLRLFEITDHGIVIGTGPAPYDGMLSGRTKSS
jgi:circadian clock protein KaiC